MTDTLAVPGATLSFAVRGDLADATPERPPLLVFGSPMDSSAFGTLAGHFDDRVVVLVDPQRFGEGVEGAVDRYVAMTRATGRLVVLTT